VVRGPSKREQFCSNVFRFCRKSRSLWYADIERGWRSPDMREAQGEALLCAPSVISLLDRRRLVHYANCLSVDWMPKGREAPKELQTLESGKGGGEKKSQCRFGIGKSRPKGQNVGWFCSMLQSDYSKFPRRCRNSKAHVLDLSHTTNLFNDCKSEYVEQWFGYTLTREPRTNEQTCIVGVHQGLLPLQGDFLEVLDGIKDCGSSHPGCRIECPEVSDFSVRRIDVDPLDPTCEPVLITTTRMKKLEELRYITLSRCRHEIGASTGTLTSTNLDT
jgi:hypothetical protein